MTLLSVSNLGAMRGGRPVLRDVSFDIGPGEFVALIGPNGAGKSTLLGCLAGLFPRTGNIGHGARDAARMTPTERALLVAYLAQERDLAWPMPVETLVGLGRSPHLGRFAPFGPTDHAAVESAMRRMDVLAFRRRPATELSGGELARVLIARALAQETPLLLADEPTAALDPAHQIEVMQLFRNLAADGRSVMAATHDLGFAARWCTRLILVHRGRVVIDGTPEHVLAGTWLQDAFGVSLLQARIEGEWVVQPLDIIPSAEKGAPHV